MAQDNDERIVRLLDQLESRNLTQAEVDRIQSKIEYLKSLEE